MEGHLPVRATAEQVSLGDKSFSGSRLGYEFVSRSPLNVKRYVVVISMNHWSEVKSWRLHPSRDGITDYVVYDLQGIRPRMIGAGYFGGEVWKDVGGRSATASVATSNRQ
jgi:hypothetical protein